MEKNMFKYRTVAIALLTGSGLTAMAQTQYDAVRYSDKELNGTARFVGMGGAMSALGADISVMGTNPAGTALFRGHDVSASFGFNSTQAESDFSGNKMTDKRLKASFDQIGFVLSNKIGNRTTLRYVNFGFNYHKSRNFNRQFKSGGLLYGESQTQQMANMIGGAVNSVSELDDIYNYDGSGAGPYSPTSVNYPYLGVMGVRTELVGVGTFQDEQGTYEAPIGWYGDANGYQSREEGGINTYNFNLSANIEDWVYLGVTLGVYDVNYRRSTYYTEDVYDGENGGYYELRNSFRTEGTGIDVKLGAIFRPIDDSPFRFGIAVHTPVWYSLKDTYSSEIYSSLSYDDGTRFEGVESPFDYVGGETVREYNLTTPWRFNVSMGTVLEGIMAVGAEYEYATYPSAELSYTDGYKMENQNIYIDEDLQGEHTVRVGMETRITSSFSLRAGYNYSTAIFKEAAYKALEYNDMRTDVEYENNFGRHTATVGLGYAGKMFYADLAYKYDAYKSDFYAFSSETLSATKVNNNRHQLLFTLGVHF